MPTANPVNANGSSVLAHSAQFQLQFLITNNAIPQELRLPASSSSASHAGKMVAPSSLQH